MHSPPLPLSPMERKDRKRKAQEIAESPVLVNEAITELATELAKSDALLRTEINSLKGKVASLQKQLTDKTEECVRSQDEAAFLHPDAVIDRVRVKLWHHGDLTLLRKVIDPRPRVLRNTEARSERTLFLCETPTKKASARAQLGGSQTFELSPKREGDEEAAPLVATSPPLSPAANIDAVTSEKKSEETTNSPSMSKIDELNNQPKDVVCGGTAA